MKTFLKYVMKRKVLTLVSVFSIVGIVASIIFVSERGIDILSSTTKKQEQNDGYIYHVPPPGTGKMQKWSNDKEGIAKFIEELNNKVKGGGGRRIFYIGRRAERKFGATQINKKIFKNFYTLCNKGKGSKKEMPHTIYYIKDSQARVEQGKWGTRDSDSSRRNFYEKHEAAKTLSELIRENLVDNVVTRGTGGATFISGLWRAINSNKSLTPPIELHAIFPIIDIHLLNFSKQAGRGEGDTVLVGLKDTSIMYFNKRHSWRDYKDTTTLKLILYYVAKFFGVSGTSEITEDDVRKNLISYHKTVKLWEKNGYDVDRTGGGVNKYLKKILCE